MKRTDLVSTLKIIEPALSGKDFFPVLTCFCFSGKHVLAYDDVVALQAPCPAGIEGGLRGKLLSDYLSKSRAEEVLFEPGENGTAGAEITVRLGKAGGKGGSKLKMPLLPSDQFVFAFPAPDGATELPASPELTAGLALAALGMSSDPSTAWMMGVTAVFGAKRLTLYGSDNKTASRVSVRVKGVEREEPILFPPQFVSRLIAVGKADPITKLLAHQDWLQAEFQSGLRLFSRTVKGVDAKTYSGLFEQADAVAGTAVPIPAGLERCIERAEVVAGFSTDPFTEFKLEGERLRLKTESAAAHATDAVKLPGLPDITVRAAPALLARALPHVSGIALHEEFVLLVGEGFTHLISTIQIDV